MKSAVERNLLELNIRGGEQYEEDDRLFGLGKESVLRVFLKLVYLHEKFGETCIKPKIYMHNAKMQKFCKVSKNTLLLAKRKLEEKGLITTKIDHGYGFGSVCVIRVTASGLALYEKMKQPEKEKKPKVYDYTDGDSECARYFYKKLRSYWKDSPSMSKNIGSWEETKDIRSDCFRKARKESGMDSEQIMDCLRTLCESDNAEFFYKNCIAPNKLNKKWKNGLTVFMTMVSDVEILKRESKSEKDKEFCVENEPEFLDDNDRPVKAEENICKVWRGMWDILNGRLRTKYKTKPECDYAYNSVWTLCGVISDFVKSDYFYHVHMKNRGLYDEAVSDNSLNYYWYYILDEYSGWNGIITPMMLWSKWEKFINSAWKFHFGDYPQNNELDEFLTEYSD